MPVCSNVFYPGMVIPFIDELTSVHYFYCS